MGSKFKDRELGEIKADERGDAEAGAPGGVDCFDVLLQWRRVSIGWLERRHLIRSDERWRGKRVSAGLLQHGKRVLEQLNNVLKGQG